MEKQSSITSSKFIGSTLDNIILNSKINLSQIKEVIHTLDKATKAIIIPILKIQKKINTEYDNIIKDNNDNKNKKSQLNNEISEQNEESKSNINNNPNQKNENGNMIELYNNMINNIDLFVNFIKSDEYDKLIKGFDDILPDKEIFIEEEIEKPKKNEEEEKLKEKIKEMENNKEKMEIEIEKVSKHNTKVKKNKKTTSKKNSKKKDKKISSKKDKKKSTKTKKPKKSKDLLETLQNEFPNNSYVQKISKTFLSRRLFKKIIYRHFFEYKEDGQIIEDRIRSAGESTVYKYGKITFKFLNDEIKNIDKIEEIVGKEFKQKFSKLIEENKDYIIGGKIGCNLNDLIQKIFKINLLNEFNVVKATLEFYEFYEELVNEFDENDKNVKIISCEEKVLKHLREDWKNLDKVRNYISQKKNIPIVLN